MVLLAIDGNSLINRAFFGVKTLTTRDGRYTNAVFGFLNMFLSLREKYRPDAIAVAFDVRTPTFRHQMYDEYKAGRKGMPPELAEQFPVIKEILAAMGICTVEAPGYEADDILGTLSESSADHCYIATGDRDSLQLVADKVTVLLTTTKFGQTQTVEYDKEKLMADYSMTPSQMIDLKALMGDASDHIPGVPGIGKKTATELLLQYGSLDAIYRDVDGLNATKSVKSKLTAGRDSAYLSYRLGTICKKVPIDTDPASYLVRAVDSVKLRSLLGELEMFKMIERLHLPDAPVAAASTCEMQEAFCISEDESLLDSLTQSGQICLLLRTDAEGKHRWLIGAQRTVLSLGDTADEAVLALLCDEKIKKLTDASKPLHRFALEHGRDARGIVFDCELAGYLLNPNASDYSVLAAAATLGLPAPQFAAEGSMADGAGECALLSVVADKQTAQMASNEQTVLYEQIELPLARVLASMELLGFQVNREGIETFGVDLAKKIDALVSEIYEEAGETFNINSPKQLGAILFDKLKLPAKKKTKTGYSTNAEVLEGLAADYPIVEKILQYRTLAKLKSTYCDGLIKVIGQDGRIHSTFHQTETRTGRISSSEPNLQNIPVRSDLGREMRRFFVAKDGYVLADADYSQIELRVLAALSEDPAMIDAFNHKEDIHTVTASQVFSLPPEMITPALRSRAKAVNFGIVYGIGAFSLAKDIGVSRFEADQYIKSYLSHYSGVDAYMKHCIETAKEKGYAETLFHRRRYLPELTASNAMQRAFGERVARNMPIQGTAADIIKIAMVRVYEKLKQEGLKSRLVLQVHDELIVETAPGETQAVSRILSGEMEHAVSLSVELTADVHFGQSWYEAKE